MKHIPKISTVYKLAFPAIISHATVMFISLIDLLFISRLGNAAIAIAAIAIANNICAAIYYFLEGIRSGTTVLVARFLGAQEHNNITKTLNFAFFAAITMGAFIVIISPLISTFIYSFLQNETASKLGKSYLSIRLLGVPFHLTIFAIIGLFRGLKNTLIPFIITITVCSLNILLNYYFLPFKINGIATATLLAYIIGAIFSFIMLSSTPISKIYLDFKKSFRSIIKTFTKIGIEIGLYSGILIIALFLFVGIFISLGTEIFAAHQIVFQIFIATYLPPMGFFVASAILIGKLAGEGNSKSIIPATIHIWLYSLPLVLSIPAITALFAPQIATFFSPTNPKIVQLAIPSIYIVCLTQFFSAIYLVLKGALTAVKDTRFLFIAGTITSYIIFLPLSYILGISLKIGIAGGYIAFLIWTILDCIIFSYRFFITKPWRFNNV